MLVDRQYIFARNRVRGLNFVKDISGRRSYHDDHCDGRVCW